MRTNPDFQKLLAVVLAGLLAGCDDPDSDVRMNADESLNKVRIRRKTPRFELANKWARAQMYVLGRLEPNDRRRMCALTRLSVVRSSGHLKFDRGIPRTTPGTTITCDLAGPVRPTLQLCSPEPPGPLFFLSLSPGSRLFALRSSFLATALRT